MFVTNWISTTKIQKISEITNFFRHYFLSRTEVSFHIVCFAFCLQRYDISYEIPNFYIKNALLSFGRRAQTNYSRTISFVK